LDNVLAKVKSEYPVDEDQIHCSGYSMGSRGCWRYATNRPGVLASVSPAAGAAESKGDGTLSQQYAEPTFDLLDKIITLPIRQFDGTYDNTAGTESPRKTQKQLLTLGSEVSTLNEIACDHSGLSTKPFTTDLMNWMLKNKRSGFSSSDDDGDGDSEDDGDSDDESSSVSAATPSGTKKVQASSVTVENPKVTQTSSGGKKCKGSKKSKRSSIKKNKRNNLTLAKMLNSGKKEKRGRTLDAIIAARSPSPAVEQNASANNNPLRRHVNEHTNVGRAHPGHQARMMGRRLSK